MFPALVRFEGTALVISRLHGREPRIAREAAAYRAGMKKLYGLSRSSLLLDLRQPVGPQPIVLVQRIFDAPAVALFDANLGRQDRVGDWQPSEEDLAKECFLRDAAKNDLQRQTSERLLRGGSKRTGALVVRGKLSPILVDTLAALAAIAMIDTRASASFPPYPTGIGDHRCRCAAPRFTLNRLVFTRLNAQARFLSDARLAFNSRVESTAAAKQQPTHLPMDALSCHYTK